MASCSNFLIQNRVLLSPLCPVGTCANWGPLNRSAERAEREPRAQLNEKTPNLPAFSCKINSFWLLVRTWHPRQRKNFVIIRGVHPWKLPHLASASLLTAASEVLSISSSSPAPSALSDVRLYHTALGDTIAKHAWSLCPYQSALMFQRSGVGDPPV